MLLGQTSAILSHQNMEKKQCCRRKNMANDEENVVIKDFDSIDAELGDTHVLRLLSHLVTDSPSSQEELLQLHQECQKVFSKYPRPSPPKELKKKPSPPKRALSQQGRLGNHLKPTDIANRRERPQMVTHHPPTSKPQIVIEPRKLSN